MAFWKGEEPRETLIACEEVTAVHLACHTRRDKIQIGCGKFARELKAGVLKYVQAEYQHPGISRILLARYSGGRSSDFRLAVRR
jgi:hypothetical protein